MAIPVEKQSDALKILQSIALQTRDDPGCLSCCIYRDIEDVKVLLFQEQWNSEERLALHVRSSEYRNILLVMEMSAKKPEVRFDTISDSSGIEIVEKMRSTF